MGTESILAGKSVLVTGGSGSFGNAFVRRALSEGASRVCVLSRSESKQATMAAELNDPRMRFFIGDVRDERRVQQAVRGCDYVIHAAALKRVETCEADPDEAVATNIAGTKHVASACVAMGVARCVLLSTDKAAAPNTLYGQTKAVAERLWIRSNAYSAGLRTKFSATRYGNVLGSTGSVVPLFRAQFEQGKPLTITSAECSRFWMTLDDAVDLVCRALDQMVGGEVFVPKIGGASVLDLARAIVETNGTYGPGHVETGLRPGEKLHELLISEDESRHTTDAGSHYVIHPESPTWTDAPTTVAGSTFTYRSDTAPRLSVTELREMMGTPLPHWGGA